MKVKATTSMAVSHGGGSVTVYAFGEVIDLPEHEAEAHIAAGNAERIEAPAAPAPQTPEVETATQPRPKEEQAVRSPKRPRQ